MSGVHKNSTNHKRLNTQKKKRNNENRAKEVIKLYNLHMLRIESAEKAAAMAKQSHDAAAKELYEVANVYTETGISYGKTAGEGILTRVVKDNFEKEMKVVGEMYEIATEELKMSADVYDATITQYSAAEKDLENFLKSVKKLGIPTQIKNEEKIKFGKLLQRD